MTEALRTQHHYDNAALHVCISEDAWVPISNEETNMPAKSKKQRRLMAIAEHEPSKLYKRNKGVAKMSKQQLHDFAATKEKKLPTKVKKKRGK